MAQERAKHSLATLSDGLTDRILTLVFEADPSLRLVFLAECGTILHSAAVRVLFNDITIHDDARSISLISSYPKRALVSVVLANSERYATAVRSITVKDPEVFSSVGGSPSLFVFDDDESSSETDASKSLASNELQPIAADIIERILRSCRNLRSFSWTSTTLPPDGICEMLSTYNAHLSTFVYRPEPPIIPTTLPLPKWDAPSLPMLNTLNIKTLHVARLSQVGSRAFAHLLSLVEDEPNLESVTIDIGWLDDNLCNSIARACRKVHKLQISSEGTRLNDNGVLALMESCDVIEEFSLVDAHGRLSKALWSKVDSLPPTLHKFKVAITESTIAHSWAIDHLAGLDNLSIGTLTHLSILRLTHPFDTNVAEAAVPKPVSQEFLLSLQSATRLQVLHCDWWLWKPEDVRVPLEKCARLRDMKVTFDAPIAKLLSMTAPFSVANNLEHIGVIIPPIYCPTLPPSPTTSVHPYNGSTPGTSPVLLQNPLSSSMTLPESYSSKIEDRNTPPSTVPNGVDPSVPPLRDVRKLIRRCTKLSEIEWYGRNGRGSWIITYPQIVKGSTTKTLSSPNIEFVPSAAGLGLTWEKVRLEQDAVRIGWYPGCVDREGAQWVGNNAQIFGAARAAEREKEEIALKEEKAARAARRGGSLSIPQDSTAGKGALSPLKADREDSPDDGSYAPPTPSSPIAMVSTPKKSSLRSASPIIARKQTGQRRVSAPCIAPLHPSTPTTGSLSTPEFKQSHSRSRAQTLSGAPATPKKTTVNKGSKEGKSNYGSLGASRGARSMNPATSTTVPAIAAARSNGRDSELKVATGSTAIESNRQRRPRM